MNGRNGKQLITPDKIETVKRFIKSGLSIKESAVKAGVSYTVAQRINRNCTVKNKENKGSEFFEHSVNYPF